MHAEIIIVNALENAEVDEVDVYVAFVASKG